MSVHNSDIADIFNKVADMLEIDGANVFRVRAYRDAAATINGQPRSIKDMVEQGEDLTELPGIGKDLAGKIEEIVKTGELSQLKELEKKVPPELVNLLKIQGLGPKKIQKLHRELGINNLEDLKKALEKGEVRKLEGFGKKTEENILSEISRMKETGQRILLAKAERPAEDLRDYLEQIESIQKIEIAGSYRRKKETVGDLDILVMCEDSCSVMEHFVNFEDVKKVLSHGETKSSIILRSGLQVDLRVIPEQSYGAALNYFTGSKQHNIVIRKMGIDRGLKINEYGVFRDDERIAGRTEQEVYDCVDLPYIIPELRENRGEFEAARRGELPDLVTREDLKGDLHSHTRETDGHNTIEEMAEAAMSLGYEYFGVSDHSKKVAMANGLDEERLSRQIEKIDRIQDKFDIHILKGIEVDILEDGSLDLSDEILSRLDFTICSVHYKFNLPRDKQTERILKAMENPNFTILGHPTGRLLTKREPYQVDMEKIIKGARDTGTFIELNAHPMRLDITDIYAKMAKDEGVLIAIFTDAHRPSEFKYIKYGINQARRGWLEADDILNTRSYDQLIKLLKSKK